MNKKSSGSDHQENQYNFYHLDNDPYSLTITKKPQTIKDIIGRQATYVWVYGNANLTLSKQQIQQKAELKIHFIQKVQQVKQQFYKQQIILICHIYLIKQVQNNLDEMIQQFRIKCLIFYGKIINSTLNTTLFNKITTLYFSNQQQTINTIRQDKYLNSKGDFINFISLQKQIWDSNILAQTVITMVNQTTPAKQIIKDLVFLAKVFYPGYSTDIEQFLKLYQQKNHLKTKQAVRWYTKETFLYRLVNRVLRISRDPTCLFIIQPYFKDLFQGIRNLYTKQRQKLQYTYGLQVRSYIKFSCYRGGQISESQIKFFKQNINKLVQNLGFLSTSRSIYQVEHFIGNALFEIEVDDTLREPQLDYGYADVVFYSQKKQQQQIIFNPLNSFKIVGYSQDLSNFSKIIHRIKLKYGEMARVTTCQNCQLTEQQLTYKWQGEYQKKYNIIFNKISDVLIQKEFILQGCQQFLNKFTQLINQNNSKDQFLQIEKHQMRAIIANNKSDYKVMEEECLKSLEIQNTLLGSNQKNIDKIYLQTLSRLGFCYLYTRQYSKAFKYYEKCQQIYKQKNQINISNYGIILCNLGLCYQNQGKYEIAKSYYIKCLQIIRNTLGENHPIYSVILNNLGSCYLYMNKYQKAIHYHSGGQKIARNVLGQNHPTYLYILSNLGKSYAIIGQYQIALECLQRCQEIVTKTQYQIHPIYAIILYSLADYYLTVNQYQKAIEYSMKIIKNAEDYQLYTNILNKLGQCYQRNKQYKIAVEYYEKCLKLTKKQLGQGHQNYAIALKYLGDLFYQAGQYEKSFNYYHKCLKIRRNIFRQNNLVYIFVIRDLGSVCFEMGKYQKALDYFQAFLKIIQNQSDHYYVLHAIALNNLANCYVKIGQWQKAIQFLTKCLRINNQSSYSIYLTTLDLLGDCYFSLNQYQKALEYYKKCQEIASKKFGNNHSEYVIAINNLGNFYHKIGQNKKFMQYIYKSLKIIQKIKIKTNQQYQIYVIAVQSLGESLKQIGQYQKASKCFEECLKIRIRKIGRQKSKFKSLLNNLGICSQKIGQYSRALEYFQKCQKISTNQFLQGQDYLVDFTKLQAHDEICLKIKTENIENNDRILKQKLKSQKQKSKSPPKQIFKKQQNLQQLVNIDGDYEVDLKNIGKNCKKMAIENQLQWISFKLLQM